MMILISGSSGSGKSRYAEGLAAKLPKPRVYIATMVSQNAENEARIEKHRRQRAGLDFRTIEEPWAVGSAALEKDAVVLLEDASNLLANLMFSEGGTAERALREILILQRCCSHLLVVTISGLSEDGYVGETAAYIRDLNRLNSWLLERADAAVELRQGAPIMKKGNVDEIL